MSRVDAPRGVDREKNLGKGGAADSSQVCHTLKAHCGYYAGSRASSDSERHITALQALLPDEVGTLGFGLVGSAKPVPEKRERPRAAAAPKAARKAKKARKEPRSPPPRGLLAVAAERAYLSHSPPPLEGTATPAPLPIDENGPPRVLLRVPLHGGRVCEATLTWLPGDPRTASPAAMASAVAAQFDLEDDARDRLEASIDSQLSAHAARKRALAAAVPAALRAAGEPRDPPDPSGDGGAAAPPVPAGAPARPSPSRADIFGSDDDSEDDDDDEAEAEVASVASSAPDAEEADRLLSARREAGFLFASGDVPVGGDRDGHFDDCEACGMGGDLVCCDYCPRAFHGRCLGTEASKRLLQDEDGALWRCGECDFDVGGYFAQDEGDDGALAACAAAQAARPASGDFCKAPVVAEARVRAALTTLAAHAFHRFFAEPVEGARLEGYTHIVRRPMDFGTIAKNADEGAYAGPDGAARAICDFRAVFHACAMYNKGGSPIARAGNALRALWAALEGGVAAGVDGDTAKLLARQAGSLDAEKADAEKAFTQFYALRAAR